MEKSLFDIFREYVNDNENFTRVELSDLGYHLVTIDNYRRTLEICGYVEKTGRGTYKRIKRIPLKYSSSFFKREAQYNNKQR